MTCHPQKSSNLTEACLAGTYTVGQIRAENLRESRWLDDRSLDKVSLFRLIESGNCLHLMPFCNINSGSYFVGKREVSFSIWGNFKT